MDSTTLDQAYTPKEAAAILKCSQDHVISLIRSGRLPAQNIGLGKRRARYLITAESIRKLIEPPVSVETKKRAPPSPRRWV